jgi:hypothetical protein
MQQRCDRLNGQLTLQSQPGQGSCILIQIPITPPDREFAPWLFNQSGDGTVEIF